MENVAGRGRKQCKNCLQFCGVRTKTCSCGYEFGITSTSVPASTEPMTIEPLENKIKDAVSSAKSILNKVENQNLTSTPKFSSRTAVETGKETEHFETKPEVRRYSGRNRVTYTPAGDCPFKPEGFKNDKWPNGPASDEVVQNWAIQVFNSSPNGEIYDPHAVVYWARYFWDINGSEYTRIRNLIFKALAPQINTQNLED